MSDCFLNSAREHGLHVDEIVQRLGIPMDKIKSLFVLSFHSIISLYIVFACVPNRYIYCFFCRDAIEYHVDIGNIYSTIDENHYKSACNG